MKYAQYTAVAAAILLALPAEARDVNETLDAAPDGRVKISNVSGSIDVRGWSRNAVEVTGDLGDDVEELQFDRSGDTVRIKVKVPERGGRFQDSSADLVIQVPERSAIEVAAVSADIDVRSVSGEQSLHAVSGDIDTEVFGEDVDVETVSGDIELQGDGVAVRTVLNSVSGDISGERIAGELIATTVSGDLGVIDATLSRGGFETVNGDVTVRMVLLEGGRIDAETVNGDVNLEFGGDLSAEFDIDTFNGEIDNCFGPKAERTSKYAPGWELRFAHGGGDGRVRIKTLNGGISICTD